MSENNRRSEEAPSEHGGLEEGLMPLLSKSPHSGECIRYIESTVEETISSVRTAFSKVNIILPTDDEIFEQMVMTKRFRPEQIKGLKKTTQTPGLIILPPQMKKFGDYNRFLNANKKRRGQRDVFVSDNREQAFASQDEKLQKEGNCALYRFGIGETAQELDNRSGKLRNIITEWTQSELAKVLRVPTPREYAGLQGQASDLLDLNGWSILCEEDKPHNIIGNDGLVSGGRGYNYWHGDAGVNFYGNDPGHGCL